MKAALGGAGLPTVGCLQPSNLLPTRCQRHQLTVAIGDDQDTQMPSLGTADPAASVSTHQGPSPCQERRLQHKLPSGRRAVECPRCRSRRAPVPALERRGSSRCISGEEGNREPIQRHLGAPCLPVCSPESCGQLRAFQWLCANGFTDVRIGETEDQGSSPN